MRLKQLLVICFISLIGHFCFSQSKINTFLKPSDTLNILRRNSVVISESVIGGVALIGLNQLWYNDFKNSKLHSINDFDEWLQMDKLGHIYSSYQIGKYGAEILNWCGIRKKHQLIYGATLGLSFLTVVEVFDGHSNEWGFSWSDMGANVIGTGVYVGQELLWKSQRLQLKYSFHQTHFASQRPNTLGSHFLEQVLKDYNGQTYWLSVNINSFFPRTKLPKWLNIAFGYGADGLLTGHKETNILAFKHQKRNRQFYFSLDVDLTKITTNSHTLKTLLSVFNTIKIPFPAMEFTDKNGVKLLPIYF